MIDLKALASLLPLAGLLPRTPPAENKWRRYEEEIGGGGFGDEGDFDVGEVKGEADVGPPFGGEAGPEFDGSEVEDFDEKHQARLHHSGVPVWELGFLTEDNEDREERGAHARGASDC